MEESLSRQVVIVNELGLHARSAAKIAKIARDAISNVRIQKDHHSVDAASVIDVLTLDCPVGSIITISVDDPADRGILTQICELVESGFGE